MATIKMERVVTTKDYEFTVPLHKDPHWALYYRGTIGKDEEKNPTYSEIFAIVEDIFGKTSEEECHTISFFFKLTGESYTFYRERMNKLHFFETLFGDKTI